MTVTALNIGKRYYPFAGIERFISKLKADKSAISSRIKIKSLESSLQSESNTSRSTSNKLSPETNCLIHLSQAVLSFPKQLNLLIELARLSLLRGESGLSAEIYSWVISKSDNADTLNNKYLNSHIGLVSLLQGNGPRAGETIFIHNPESVIPSNRTPKFVNKFSSPVSRTLNRNEISDTLKYYNECIGINLSGKYLSEIAEYYSIRIGYYSDLLNGNELLTSDNVNRLKLAIGENSLASARMFLVKGVLQRKLNNIELAEKYFVKCNEIYQMNGYSGYEYAESEVEQINSEKEIILHSPLEENEFLEILPAAV